MSKEACWKPGTSKSGRKYFTNIETGVSQWGKPVFPGHPYPIGWEYHISTKTGNKYYRNAAKGITQWDEPEIEKQPELIKGWITHNSTNCDQTYYENTITKETTWIHPNDNDSKRNTKEQARKDAVASFLLAKEEEEKEENAFLDKQRRKFGVEKRTGLFDVYSFEHQLSTEKAQRAEAQRAEEHEAIKVMLGSTLKNPWAKSPFK